MALIGLKYPVFAPIATEPAGALPTYAAGLVVGDMMAANVAVTMADNKLYANDKIVEVDKGFVSGKITIGIDDLSDDSRVGWLGDEAVTEGENTVIRSTGDGGSPQGGFGYYRVKKKLGIIKYQVFWFFKTKFGIPSEDAKTKGETIEWQTPTVEGDIFATDTPKRWWRDIVTFADEADAIAWLNAKAGLPVTASAGLSTLELTSAGGTLSPAFGADVRYYTYSGVTGANVTITATAATHTLKLYVDGVLSQTLISGTASAAIPLAIGTKKLTIVAQEAGEQSQTTEIIVVKTA